MLQYGAKKNMMDAIRKDVKTVEKNVVSKVPTDAKKLYGSEFYETQSTSVSTLRTSVLHSL